MILDLELFYDRAVIKLCMTMNIEKKMWAFNLRPTEVQLHSEMIFLLWKMDNFRFSSMSVCKKSSIACDGLCNMMHNITTIMKLNAV